MIAVQDRPIRTLMVALPAGQESVIPACLSLFEGFTVVECQPEEVLAECSRHLPDVVIVDVHWPMQSGLRLIRQIMTQVAVPVIAIGDSDLGQSFAEAATAAGALLTARRPVSPEHPRYREEAAALADAVHLMAEVRVVRRRERHSPVEKEWRPGVAKSAPRIIAIGASTGGPAVLETIFRALPADFPLPIVIVQHIATGFLPGMIEWLQATSCLRLGVGSQDAPLQPGHAYFAPDGQQMGVEGMRIVLGPALQDDGHCPSASYLFRSVAESFGAAAMGILLTGMGRDGALGLLRLRQAGAMTIAQDRESCVVFGMPGQAEELGAVVSFMAPAEIAGELLKLTDPGKWLDRSAAETWNKRSLPNAPEAGAKS